MDELIRERDETAADETGINRRAFFGRTLLLVGGAATVLTLSGCPGGNGDGDDDEGDDGGDDGDDD